MESHRINEIQGACLFAMNRRADDCGSSDELYCTDKPDYYHSTDCRKVDLSRFKICTLQGIHVSSYHKIISCIKGRIYDVIVDMRPTSTTYGNWFGVWSEEGQSQQLFIPANCGHAFYVAEEDTQVVCFRGGEHDADRDQSLHFRSPAFGIRWPGDGYYRMSERDENAVRLENLPQPDTLHQRLSWWQRFKAAIRS